MVFIFIYLFKAVTCPHKSTMYPSVPASVLSSHTTKVEHWRTGWKHGVHKKDRITVIFEGYRCVIPLRHLNVSLSKHF